MRLNSLIKRRSPSASPLRDVNSYLPITKNDASITLNSTSNSTTTATATTTTTNATPSTRIVYSRHDRSLSLCSSSSSSTSTHTNTNSHGSNSNHSNHNNNGNDSRSGSALPSSLPPVPSPVSVHVPSASASASCISLSALSASSSTVNLVNQHNQHNQHQNYHNQNQNQHHHSYSHQNSHQHSHSHSHQHPYSYPQCTNNNDDSSNKMYKPMKSNSNLLPDSNNTLHYYYYSIRNFIPTIRNYFAVSSNTNSSKYDMSTNTNTNTSMAPSMNMKRSTSSSSSTLTSRSTSPLPAHHLSSANLSYYTPTPLQSTNSSYLSSLSSSSTSSSSSYNIYYYIKRYIQIFTFIFILHLSFVTLYNHLHVPNTCHVADLSREKLKLLNWIGRDVDYIIHDIDDNNDGNGNVNDNGNGNVNIGVDSIDEQKTQKHDAKVNNKKFDKRTPETTKMTRRRSKEIETMSDDFTTSTTSTTSASTSTSTDDKPKKKNQEEFVPQLPKIIHHQWKNNDVPSKYTKWYNQWKVHYPESEYKHILWTDETARELIATHYNWFLNTYDNYDINIKRADASRYFILHYMGGIYSDLDYEPMINFYDYLPQNQVGLIESPYVYNEKTQNSFMTSPKGDPFWIHVFKGLGANAHKSVLNATGPSFLDRMMDSSKHPVYTLPCENFHRIPYGEFTESKWTAVLGREVLTRIVPMSKHCGYFKEEDSCQFGKHHNAAGWTSESFLGI